MSNTNNTRAPRPHRASRKHSQTRRQAVANTAPERREPQRSENIEKMAAVYASAVEQREAEDAELRAILTYPPLSDRERELLNPHIYVSDASPISA